MTSVMWSALNKQIKQHLCLSLTKKNFVCNQKVKFLYQSETRSTKRNECFSESIAEGISLCRTLILSYHIENIIKQHYWLMCQCALLSVEAHGKFGEHERCLFFKLLCYPVDSDLSSGWHYPTFEPLS